MKHVINYFTETRTLSRGSELVTGTSLSLKNETPTSPCSYANTFILFNIFTIKQILNPVSNMN